MGIGGGGSSSSGQAATGDASSLSFIPSLLSAAFFGTGIGLDKGGFRSTGLGDFNTKGAITGKEASSIVNPFGLDALQQRQKASIGDLIGIGKPNQNAEQGFAGKAGSGPGTIGGLSPLTEGSASLFGNTGALGSPGTEGDPFAQFAGTGGGTSIGDGAPGLLNPLDLISNLTDIVNPDSNPGITGALRGLLGGELGGSVGNQLLLGGIAPTFAEGLQSGFKPDLQPVIDEATRAFFSDIVPQLGQNNVALQEGVGPFSSDLSAGLLSAGGTLASQLGSLEVQNQNLAGDRKNELLGLSGLISDQLFNASTNAGRNTLDLGEQLAQTGTVGGRQAGLLSFLNQLMSGSPIQASSSSNSSKSANGNLGF